MTNHTESGATAPDLPVLVVGAGPVGLTATIELLRRGVRAHCVDAAAATYPFTRSLAAWPRMMEILRGLGVELRDPALGHQLTGLRYFSDNRPVLTLGLRAHTRPMIVGQPAIEERLLAGLLDRGGDVRWRTRLLGLVQHDDRVTARLRLPDGAERESDYAYVLGADGASSTVRKLLGLAFTGTTYPTRFMLADVRLRGDAAADQARYYVSDRGVLALIGMPHGYFRVFTSAPPGFDGDEVAVEDVQRLLDERGPGGLEVSDPLWLSAFAVHARRAERMREGRVFLLGDAAHVHSPAGGQGLNTGIGDAHNLAWKLALVWRGRAAPELLASYEPERAAAVAAVVRDAHLQTRAWLVRGRGKRVARDLAARVVSRTRLADLDYVPRLAGLRVRYAPEPGASGGRFAEYRAGALAPARTVLVDGVGTPLREALDPLRYTLLVVGRGALGPAARAEVEAIAASWPDEVDVRTLRGGVLRPGLSGMDGADGAGGGARLAGPAALVLIRPDQHVLDRVRESRAYTLRERLRSLLRQGVPAAGESRGAARG